MPCWMYWLASTPKQPTRMSERTPRSTPPSWTRSPRRAMVPTHHHGLAATKASSLKGRLPERMHKS